MKVFYDFEFIEVQHNTRNNASFSGQTSGLFPISVGLMVEDGSHYYGINENAPWEIIFNDTWVRENVVIPHLPVLNAGDDKSPLLINRYHQDVKPYHRLASEIREFLHGVRDVELWADYGAYDHVLLAGMFGSMCEFPEWLPMWTHDIQHEMQHYTGIPDCWPIQDPNTEHHALEDARHSLQVYTWMHENDY